MKGTTDSLLTLMTPNPVVVEHESTLDQALTLLKRYRFRHLPVMDGDEVVGMLSDRDLRLATSLLPSELRRWDSEGNRIPGPDHVGEIMRHPVYTLPPEATPAEAAKDLIRKRIGAIPVVEEGELIGIVTESDFLKEYLELCRVNHGSCDDDVGHHMHRPLPTVGPTSTLDEALEVMDERVGHLGVVSDGELVGVISERDLFLALSWDMIRDAKAEEEGRLEHVSTAIEEVMTTDVMTTEPEASLAQCAQTLIAYRISSMPVIEKGAPVGLLTQRHIIEYYSHLI